MPLEVEKDTYMGAEGSTLQGLTHDMFKAINTKVEALATYDQGIVVHCQTQVDACEKRFGKLEISWARIGGGVVAISVVWVVAFKVAGII